MGYTAGFLAGDQEHVFIEDMIAIPARQEYLLSGTPDIKILIRGGETLMPTGGNVRDVQEAIDPPTDTVKPKKRRKLNKWQRFFENVSIQSQTEKRDRQRVWDS